MSDGSGVNVAVNTTIMGVPFDLIEEAAKVYETIPIRIMRRNSANQRFASLGTFQFKVPEIAKIEEFIREKAGGGTFFCDPRDPNNHTQPALPLKKFQVEVEGAPKPATSSDFGGTMRAGARAMEIMAAEGADISAEEFEELPHYVKVRPVSEQVEYIHAQRAGRARLNPSLFPGRRDLPASTYTSDSAMKQHAEYVQSDLMEERLKAAQREAKLEAEIKRKDEALERERQERIKVDNEARERAVKAEMEALRAQIAQPKTSPINMDLVLAALPTVGAIITALITSSTSRAATAAEQQMKAQQLQLESMNAILTKASTPPPDTTKAMFDSLLKLAPVLTPLVTQFLDSKGPKAQAELYHDMVENHMNSMTMIAELTEKLALSGGEEKWYLPVIQQGVNGVMSLMESISKAQRAQMPIPQNKPLTAPAAAQKAAQQQPQATPGQNAAALVMNNPAFPADMQTQEWFNIISKLHDHHDPQQTAETALLYMRKLESDNKLPAVLRDVWLANPLDAIGRCVNFMPVSANKEYCAIFMKEFEQLLVDAKPAEETQEASEEEEEEEEEEETAEEASEVVETVGEEIPEGAVPFNLNTSQYANFIGEMKNAQPQVVARR